MPFYLERRPSGIYRIRGKQYGVGAGGKSTGATWRYADQRDLTKLRDAGGWKSLAMVERYIHAGTDELRDMVRRHNWSIGVQSQEALSATQ